MTQAESACDRGLKMARYVARYIYVKEGKIYSIIDHDRTGEKIQIEVPYDKPTIVSLLLRMFRMNRDQDSLVRRGSCLRSPTPGRPAIGRSCTVAPGYVMVVTCEVSRKVMRY